MNVLHLVVGFVAVACSWCYAEETGILFVIPTSYCHYNGYPFPKFIKDRNKYV